METIKRGFNHLKRRRVLLRIFAVMSGLSLLCAFVCSSFWGHLILSERNAQVTELSMSQLVRIRDKVDTLLDNLASSVWGNLWTEDTLDLLLSLNLNDRPRNTRIVNALRNHVEQNELITEAVLYSPRLGYVFRSNGVWMPLNSYEGQDILLRYQSRWQELDDASRLRDGHLYREGGDLFLCFDLETPVYVGSLLYRLDTARLASILETGNGPLYVLDETGESIFSPTEQMIPEENKAIFLDEDTLNEQPIPAGRQVYYRTVSAVTGWTFLARAQVGSQLDYLPDYLPMIVPFLLIYAVLCCGLAFLLSQGLYRPIHTLLSISHQTQGDGCWEGAGDELSYLQNVYEKTYDEKKQYQLALSTVSQEVCDQVIYKLLLGRPVTREYVGSTLTAVGRESLLSACFVVLAVLLEMPTAGKNPSVEWAIFRRSLTQLFQKATPHNCQIYLSFVEEDRLAVVLQVPRDMTPQKAKELANQLHRDVTEVMTDTPATLFWGGSRFCEDLMDLPLVWSEAAEAAQCRRYAADGQLNEGVFPESREGAEEDHLIRTLRQCLDLAAESREVECSQALELLTERLREKSGLSENLSQRLHDAAVEKLALCGVEAGELDHLSARWKSADDRELELFLQETIQLIRASVNRKRYRYVEETKAYVARNYMNNSLSLNAVSDSIGISPSYLSSLFKEVTREKFNTYLGTYRVEQAQLLLRNTASSNADIGYRCGFTSEQSFYRVFKKVTGQTPSQYRESQRKKEDGHG